MQRQSSRGCQCKCLHANSFRNISSLSMPTLSLQCFRFRAWHASSHKNLISGNIFPQPTASASSSHYYDHHCANDDGHLFTSHTITMRKPGGHLRYTGCRSYICLRVSYMRGIRKVFSVHRHCGRRRRRSCSIYDVVQYAFVGDTVLWFCGGRNLTTIFTVGHCVYIETGRFNVSANLNCRLFGIINNK